MIDWTLYLHGGYENVEAMARGLYQAMSIREMTMEFNRVGQERGLWPITKSGVLGLLKRCGITRRSRGGANNRRGGR